MKTLIYCLAFVQGFVFDSRNQTKRIKGNKEMTAAPQFCFDST